MVNILDIIVSDVARCRGSRSLELESYDDGPPSISISRKNKRGLVAAAVAAATAAAPLLFCRLPEIPRHEIEEISVAAAGDSLSGCGGRNRWMWISPLLIIRGETEKWKAGLRLAVLSSQHIRFEK